VSPRIEKVASPGNFDQEMENLSIHNKFISPDFIPFSFRHHQLTPWIVFKSMTFDAHATCLFAPLFPDIDFFAQARYIPLLQVHLIVGKRKDGEIPSQASPCCIRRLRQLVSH